MPGDMSPGTEWGMMWGFSGDVTLWVLFGGRPGLELQQEKQEQVERRGGGWQREGGLDGCVCAEVAVGEVLTFGALQNAIPFQRANMYCK